MSVKKSYEERIRNIERDLQEIRNNYENLVSNIKDEPSEILSSVVDTADIICRHIFKIEISHSIARNKNLEQFINKFIEKAIIPRYIEIPFRTIQGYQELIYAQDSPDKYDKEFIQPALDGLSTIMDWFIEKYGYDTSDNIAEASRKKIEINEDLVRKAFSLLRTYGILTYYITSAYALLVFLISGLLGLLEVSMNGLFDGAIVFISSFMIIILITIIIASPIIIIYKSYFKRKFKSYKLNIYELDKIKKLSEDHNWKDKSIKKFIKTVIYSS